MSDGRSVRKTVHFTPRSLKAVQLISCGRSHFLTRCWTLSSHGKPTDFGPGGKLSSTNVTAFWERKKTMTHTICYKMIIYRLTHLIFLVNVGGSGADPELNTVKFRLLCAAGGGRYSSEEDCQSTSTESEVTSA